MNKCLALLTLVFCAQANADWGCKYEKIIRESLDVSDSEALYVAATAGDLEIRGVSGTNEIEIRGRACASKEEWVEESRVVATGGKRAEIYTEIPDSSGFTIGSRYAWIDLELRVPEGLAIEVRDSSGDVDIENVASLALEDSSGDIDLRGIRGPVVVEDSSGDITARDLGSDWTIEADSSGDIYGRGIGGSVLVGGDSSGDMRFVEVERDVVIERDSSGDIEVDEVGGDLRVLKDGSGGISWMDVEGEVDIPEGKRS